MKIILVAPAGNFTEQLRRALIKNGADILYVNDREIKILPFFKKNITLWRIIRRLPILRVMNNKLFNRDLISLCRKERPDILFINKGMTIYSETLREIKSMGVKTANWFLDNIRVKPYRDWFLNNAKLYDYFMGFDSSVLEYDGNNFYVPVGIDPDKFVAHDLSPGDRDKYSCDLCFIGGYSRDREHYLSKVSDLNLKIFGWKGWEESSLAKFYGGPLSLGESIMAYNCAKICINLNSVPPVNGVNLKTFEIPAAGGFQLSDFRKDIVNLFVIGKEIDVFHDEDELREKVIFYMKNEQSRENITQAGKIRVLRDHTLEKRAAAILKILESN